MRNTATRTLACMAILSLMFVGEIYAQSTRPYSPHARNTSATSQRSAEAEPQSDTSPTIPSGPILSTALPADGPFRNGFQLGAPVRTTARSAEPSRFDPYRNLAQQVQRARANVPQNQPSYLGLSDGGISGQRLARQSVFRGIYGELGLSGIGF